MKRKGRPVGGTEKTVWTSLAEARLKLGKSQKQMAELCGVSPGAWGFWERGLDVPQISRLPVIAEVTGIDEMDLFEDVKRLSAKK